MHVKLKVLLLIFFSCFILTGCYTVVWHPNEELPNNENSVKKEMDFYDVNNFGAFNPFYNFPWWLNPDNDFLIDNINNIYFLENDEHFNLDLTSIDTREIPVAPIPGCTLYVAPTIIKPIVSPIGKPIAISLSKSPPVRYKKSNNIKLRNNNGERKTKKGRSR